MNQAIHTQKSTVSADRVSATWPARWGEGALFAFSGADGTTDALSGFVATLGAEPCDLLWHTPRQRRLHVRCPQPPQIRRITGDVVTADTADGDLNLTFHAWHTLTGQVPVNATVELYGPAQPPGKDPLPVATEAGRALDVDPEHGDALALYRQGNRLALAFGRSAAEAETRAREGLQTNITERIQERLSFFDTAPRMPDPDQDRLLTKCFSIMKVNTLSPQGPFRQRWSTPDRVPHRELWLWDSVFHAQGMNHLSPELAWEFLASLLDTQMPDGRIPLQTAPHGRRVETTQPPVLAWGIWNNYTVLREKTNLERALPALEAYLEWDCTNRDRNANGLLEWILHPVERCRCGESGMDNSPRFDTGEPLDAVDFSTFVAHDMKYVARIAAALGQHGKAKDWLRRAGELSRRVHRDLWNDTDGFYEDRTLDGRLTGVWAVSGFLPLLLDDLPPERIERIAARLRDPEHFGTAFPVPSLSVSHPEWSTDMWRGATWINMNYLIIQGLKRHGRTDDAGWLARKTIAHVRKYAEKYGVIFEFYDARDELPPPACARKGPRVAPYDIRHKVDSIRDYHWSAALTACLILESADTLNHHP